MKDKLDKIINEEMQKMVECSSSWELNNGRKPLMEMAKLNKKDNEMSPFPSNAYSIIVQGDGSANKPPHIHIISKQEGFNIRVLINDGTLMSVVSYGDRNRGDSFSDILKKVLIWFNMASSMPKFNGTNQEIALILWDANNPD
jgi:hypothetical protein